MLSVKVVVAVNPRVLEPVLVTVKLPATVVRPPARFMAPLWLLQFQVKLPKVWPSPPGTVVVMPVIWQVEAAFQVAVGMVPPF
jgi:hypothetical protein